jgi:hypothetical protein
MPQLEPEVASALRDRTPRASTLIEHELHRGLATLVDMALTREVLFRATAVVRNTMARFDAEQPMTTPILIAAATNGYLHVGYGEKEVRELMHRLNDHPADFLSHPAPLYTGDPLPAPMPLRGYQPPGL